MRLQGISSPIVWLLLGLLLAVAESALADIYRCQTESGTYQFQQVPCADNQIVGNTAAHKAWQQMRDLSDEGERILERLGPSVESIKRCKNDMRQFQDQLFDLNTLLKQVDARAHPQLFKSYGYIQECAECRSSALAACQTADQFLDQAMINLMRIK